MILTPKIKPFTTPSLTVSGRDKPEGKALLLLVPCCWSMSRTLEDVEKAETTKDCRQSRSVQVGGWNDPGYVCWQSVCVVGRKER